MSKTAREFLIPDGVSLADVKELIRTRMHTAEDRQQEVRRRFLDSFDWRLYLVGVALEERRCGGQRQLLWRELSAGAASLVQDIDEEPGFARDLPAGPLRKQLGPVLGVRRLLPLLELRTRLLSLRLLDDDDKTVARLQAEENWLTDTVRDRAGPLAVRLRLLPVRGYETNLHKVSRILSQNLDLEEAATGVLSEALAVAGRRPGDYSSKLNYRLDPDKCADATAKEILLGLLDTLEANIEGAKANLDTEFLHDLRVATRRTRSALTQIKGVFPPDLVEDYKARFAWMQQVTGPVRDLDVYLLDFEGYQARLPAQLQPHLEPMREFLADHYSTAHKAMVRALRSARFRDLLESWRAFLEASVPEHSTMPNAQRPCKVVADERIWKMYRRVCKEGRAIAPDSPAAELHELRKSCKKLRYLLEFFSSLYPKKQVGPLVKMLKVLLDNLGGFQDLAVQTWRLREFAQEMRGEGRAETDTLLAMGALVGDLLDCQQRARLDFARIFASFDTRENQTVFRGLFAPANKRGRQP